MKNMHLVGLAVVVLSSFTAACAGQEDDDKGSSTSAVKGEPPCGDGEGEGAPGDLPPTPNPTPGPAPAPGCTPLAKPVGAVNPASVYCIELGYTAEGEQCLFPGGESCDQWSFYRGECGQAHSFCNRQGGSLANKVEDMGGWTASYAVCTLPGGAACKEETFAHSCSCE